MLKKFTSLSFLFSFLTISLQLQAQSSSNNEPDVYNYNTNSFTEVNKNIEAAMQYNNGFENHPEFGIIPFNFHKEVNAIEILSERTIDSRKFINIDKPEEFYIQKFYGPVHQMRDGYLQSLDHRLSKSNHSDIYESKKHYDYKLLNIGAKQTQIGIDQPIIFNQWTLLSIKDNQISQEWTADWSNYTVGEEGISIFKIFPGVDAEILFDPSGDVITNFIINEWKFGDAEKIIFKDQMSFFSNVSWSHNSNTPYVGDITVSTSNEAILKIKEAIAYPETMNDRSELELIAYTVENNALSLHVNRNYIENILNSGRSLIVDPVVTGTNTLAQANILGSMYNPSCNFNDYCDYDVTVNFPPNATITDATADFSFSAIGACIMPDGAMRFTMGSCISPDLPNYFWMCNNNPVPGNCNGNNIPIYQHLENCMPDPSCQSQDIVFTLQFFRRCYGTTGCANDCIAANSPFSVTVTGHTIEFDDNLTSNISANPTTICPGDPIQVSTSGQYGVPPYEYSWSLNANGNNPIGTGSNTSVTINNPGNHYLYAIITDDCGQTVVDSILITVNPLEIPEFTLPKKICQGDNLILPTTSDNNVSGTWSPATINTNNIGTFQATFTPNSNYNCSDIYEYEVEIIPIPNLDLGPDRTLCFGESTVLDPQITNMDLLWSDGSSGYTLTVNQTGTYYVTAYTDSGCEVSDTIFVEVLPENVSEEDHFTCTEDLPFIWYGQTINNGGFSVASHVFQSHQGCDSTVYLNLSTSPTPSKVRVREKYCETAYFEGEFYFETTTWDDTLYSIQGCDSVYRTVQLIVEKDEAELVVELEEHCNSYEYQGRTYTRDTMIYTGYYQSETGCDSVIIQKDIRIHHFNLSLHTEDLEVYEGERIKLQTNGTEDYHIYKWEPQEMFPYQLNKSQTFIIDETKTFTVYGYTDYGCESVAELTIKVNPLDKTVIVPNAFTPNGDGVNDYFNPLLNITEAYSIAEFNVYNRYGQLVFTNKGQLNKGWDGTFQGEPCEMDTYFYTLRVKFIDGDEFKQSGDVHLIR